MVRLPAFLAAIVSRLPMPINCSPSPVMTATGRFGCASARPRPTIAGAAHRAPQIEISGMLAGVEHVVGGRAEAGDDKQILAVGEQRLDGLAAAEA